MASRWTGHGAGARRRSHPIITARFLQSNAWYPAGMQGVSHSITNRRPTGTASAHSADDHSAARASIHAPREAATPSRGAAHRRGGAKRGEQWVVPRGRSWCHAPQRRRPESNRCTGLCSTISESGKAQVTRHERSPSSGLGARLGRGSARSRTRIQALHTQRCRHPGRCHWASAGCRD
jgi:hypothetical protein